ncbi:MAG: hypothetical protein J7J38_03880 [Candidatus Aenigmarchaeota archaeon]|nr:hypothetical protein [Candidatus Aenigmarchaeota archaeon]
MKKLVILFILLFSNISFAGYISLTTSMENIFIYNNSAEINISLLNSGDEPAFNTKLFLVLPDGFKVNELFVGTLKQNNTFVGQFNISVVKNIIPGKYTFAVLTEYSDANGYGFSSVSPSTIIYKKPTSTKISGFIKELKLGEKETKNLELKILNRDTEEHNIRAHLYLPNELVAKENDKTVLIKPNEEKEIDFSISNFGALLGSSYIVFASVEYEEDWLHYSTIVRGIVNIEKGDYSWIIICIVLILITIFVIINIRHKFKVRK